MRLQKQSGFRQLAMGLSVLIASVAPAFAQSQAHPAVAKPMDVVPNQILIMAHKGADKDECNDAVHQVNGTIVKTMTNGRITAYLVEVPEGKQKEAMTKLGKDKAHFDAVQLNHRVYANFNANDPLFPQQYGIGQMNVPAAWNFKADGKGVTIGVIDTGVNGAQTDLAGRVDHGINIITDGPGDVDLGSNGFFHGTFVSTVAAASTNNFSLGAGPAYRSLIIPVDAFNGQSSTSDANILNSIFYLESRGCRLINLSVNANVPFTFANQAVHPVLFQSFIDFYNGGGLLFNSAGNDGQFDNSPRTPYLIVISACNANQGLANFSTRGKPLWFTAAGKNVVSSDVNSQPLTADGTSFSCPYSCSVAAQIWSRNPFLTNAQVLTRMANTATQPPNYTSNKFGFGIPNAGAAVAGN
ncbi:MAG: S8 family serine peptidase [Cyanobacteria bacterium SZAS-4]|nr:S8 family serine peptidase [Cyanobacteria bacterium SZAS-4]